MLIKEILFRRRFLDNKLFDINNYIEVLSGLEVNNKTDLYNKAIEEKFALLSKIQSHEVLLQTQNSSNTIKIGTNELLVCDVVKLRDTLFNKIDTFNVIIRHGDFKVVSIFNLMAQRDDLFEEYIVLKNAIEKSDAVTEWQAD